PDDLAHGRQLDKDDVAQLFLRVIGDADDAGAALDADIFMVGCELGGHGGGLSWVGAHSGGERTASARLRPAGGGRAPPLAACCRWRLRRAARSPARWPCPAREQSRHW